MREQQPGRLRKPEKPLHSDMTGLGLEQLFKWGDSRFPAHKVGGGLAAKGDIQVPRSGDPGLGSWHSPPHRGVLLLSEHVDQDGPPVPGGGGRQGCKPWEERGAGREVLAGASTHAVRRHLHLGLRVDFDWIQGMGTLCAGRSWRGQ